MRVSFNSPQKKALSSFFISIAVAWFVAVFAVPTLDPAVTVLTMVRFIVSMVGALGIALYLLAEET